MRRSRPGPPRRPSRRGRRRRHRWCRARTIPAARSSKVCSRSPRRRRRPAGAPSPQPGRVSGRGWPWEDLPFVYPASIDRAGLRPYDPRVRATRRRRAATRQEGALRARSSSASEGASRRRLAGSLQASERGCARRRRAAPQRSPVRPRSFEAFRLDEAELLTGRRAQEADRALPARRGVDAAQPLVDGGPPPASDLHRPRVEVTGLGVKRRGVMLLDQHRAHAAAGELERRTQAHGPSAHDDHAADAVFAHRLPLSRRTDGRR